MPAAPRGAPGPTSIPILLFPGPRRRSAFSLLIYPPAGAQWSARPGGLRGGFPNPAKLIWVRFAKNGLASSRARERQRGPPGDMARHPQAQGRAVYPVPSTLHPPANPSTLYRQPVYPVPPANPPTLHRQPVYPVPPTRCRLPCTARQPANPSTLHPPSSPPGRLPCTARQPVHPAPPSRPVYPVPPGPRGLFPSYIYSKTNLPYPTVTGLPCEVCSLYLGLSLGHLGPFGKNR